MNSHPILSLLICTALIGALPAQAPFTSGNLAVLRIGDGTAALSSSAAPMFVDEYTTAGVLVQSIALPTAASGSHHMISVRGSGTSEAYLGLSTNGRYLLACGYDAPVGTADTGTAGIAAAVANRVIARVDLLGNVDTTTALADAFSGLSTGSTVSTQGNPRGIASDDGQRFWISGTGQIVDSGVRYVASLGATTSLGLNGAPSNCRVAGIYDGQLYTSSASTVFLGVCEVGSGLPVISGQTVTLLPGFPTTGSTAAESAYDFFFADPDTLYVADDNSLNSTVGGIQKWTRNGGTWTMQYRLQLGTNSGCRGLTGFVQNGAVTLWGTANTNATGGAQTVLVTVTDTGPGSVVTALATSPANTAFRGLRHLAKPTTVQRFPDSCGTTDIKVNGNGQACTGVRTTMLGPIGIPFIGYGLTPSLTQFCACHVAHDFLLTVLGPSHTLAVPMNPAFAGLTVYIQGADLMAPGACSPSLSFTLTDSFTFVVQ